MKNAPPRWPLLAVLCACLPWAGCKTPFQKKLFLAPHLSISAIAIEPFGFRWPEPVWRSLELSQRLVTLATKKVDGSALLFGPGEFKVLRSEDDSWASTNVVALLPAVRVSPEAAVLLRPWAEKRVTSSRQEIVDARGKAAGAGVVEEVTLLGHVEVVHPSTRTVIVDVTGQAQVDPFAPRAEDEADPSPELTRLMQTLTAAALAELQGHLSPPAAARDFQLTYAFNPQATFAYAEEGRPSLEATLAGKDALEGELLRLARVRYANPGMADTQAAKLAGLPGGLYITQAPAGSPLAPGDLITAVVSEPAVPAALQRARFRQGPVRLQVRRADGTQTELALP